jgi:hypothetical protein
MHDQPRPAVVAAIVNAIDARTTSQTAWMLWSLVRGAWPGGPADRRDPVASEWVRRWGPGTLDASHLGDCSCAAGRCAVCN